MPNRVMWTYLLRSCLGVHYGHNFLARGLRNPPTPSFNYFVDVSNDEGDNDMAQRRHLTHQLTQIDPWELGEKEQIMILPLTRTTLHFTTTLARTNQ